MSLLVVSVSVWRHQVTAIEVYAGVLLAKGDTKGAAEMFQRADKIKARNRERSKDASSRSRSNSPPAPPLLSEERESSVQHTPGCIAPPGIISGVLGNYRNIVSALLPRSPWRNHSKDSTEIHLDQTPTTPPSNLSLPFCKNQKLLLKRKTPLRAPLLTQERSCRQSSAGTSWDDTVLFPRVTFTRHERHAKRGPHWSLQIPAGH